MKKKSLRWIELVGIIVIAAALVAIVLPALSRAREASDRASCQDNLKQWGAIFKMYASENSGYYPRCATKNERTNTDSPEHGFVAAPYGPSLYPNYVSDLNLFFCPSSEESAEDYTKCPGGRWCNIKTNRLDAANFNDCCYTYFGWAAMTESELAAILACLRIEDCSNPANDSYAAHQDLFFENLGGSVAVQTTFEAIVKAKIKVTGSSLPVIAGNYGGSSICRLKEGVERFLPTDIHGSAGDVYHSALPIMWDTISSSPDNFSHLPVGHNVLYMDGHVEFLKYPSKYPASKLSAGLVGLIDQADPLAP